MVAGNSRCVFAGSRRAQSPRLGFTLVELLIVVTILGILGALVIPQFSNASDTARENVLKEDLRNLRSQTLTYAIEHNDVPPGHPGGNPSTAATEAAFISQMTNPTNVSGTTGPLNDANFRFGPYMRIIPENPINNLSTIRVIGAGAFPTDPAGTHGWVYQPSTKTWAADNVGSDLSGTRYFDY